MNNLGFLKVYRSFFDNELWTELRVYSRAEAWLDLMASAKFDSSQEIHNGREVEVATGEIVASRRFLEKRWGWSNTKVDRFIEYLKKRGMLITKNASGLTVLKLCNYEYYNGLCLSENATKNATETPVKRQRNAKYKEYKEVKNNITITSTPNVVDGYCPNSQNISFRTNKNAGAREAKTDMEVTEGKTTVERCDEREVAFYDELTPMVEAYGKTMIRKFYDYWRERTKNRTRMRFECEKTWDLNLRLQNWQNRENDYENERTKQTVRNGSGRATGGASRISDDFKRGILERLGASGGSPKDGKL